MRYTFISYFSLESIVHITLNIPDAAAAVIQQLADVDGITPTQWVTRVIQRAVQPPTATQLGRPKVNQTRDAEIRAKRAAGQSVESLASEYGLSVMRIHQITKYGF